MEFRILGPLEVIDGRERVRLEASKQRALLGVLLLHPNEVVSSDRLIDELWGERPPSTATKVVQTYVSQLRKAVGPDAIVTRPPGYMLRIEEDGLDAVRFRHLTSEGRRLAARGEPARADELYCEALGLWRGPPLADVVFESFARNEAEGLEEERLGVLMDRIDCELALGRHDQLVVELETLVRQYPLRERLRAQLMLALYRSGRQADALTAYQNARRTLVDELGLEPSRELQDLEQAILSHAATLEPPPAAARERPPRRRVRGRRAAAAVAALVLIAVVSGLALALRGGEPASVRLAPNSVGFIDARTARVTRSYPVGREPSSLTVADGSLWVANYRDQTVTRIDRATGQSLAIPVGGHPSGLTAHRDTIWVWTLEGQLVPIDPRFNSAGDPVPLGGEVARLSAPAGRVAPFVERTRAGGARIASGGGFLWLTWPPTAVIRVNPVRPALSKVIVPRDGAQGAIAYRERKAWVAGFDHVFSISANTRSVGLGVLVGRARSFTFGFGSLWVAGGEPVAQGIVRALRRVDLRSRLVEAMIRVGSDPIAVAAADGSIWVADRHARAIRRVDPAKNRAVETIPLGARPTALAADGDGIWVAIE